MPILTPLRALSIGFVIASTLFLASAYFTRADRRRIVGALAGALAYGLMTYGWDRLAASVGWWHYPYDPAIVRKMLALYVPAGLVAGGAFGLNRLARNSTIWWSWPGGIPSSLGIWGVIHDIGGSALFANSNLMVFELGRRRWLATFSITQLVAQWRNWRSDSWRARERRAIEEYEAAPVAKNLAGAILTNNLGDDACLAQATSGSRQRQTRHHTAA